MVICLSSFKIVCIKSWLLGMFPKLRKTQTVNLTLGVFGLIKARSGILSEIAREVPGSRQHKHRLKRLDRFVDNDRIKVGNLINLWCLWIIRIFLRRKYIEVALDWTTLPGNIQCLMAAVPYAGRAVPLLWVTTTYQAFKDSQNLIEQRLVTRLLTIIPKEKKIILVADRGFGRAKFFKFLLKLNILFAIRVRADVKIKTKCGKVINLRKLRLKANQVKWFEDISYREDGFVPSINLAATIAGGSDDSWLIVTNLPQVKTTIQRYQMRFQIEEWFKDLKHELGLDGMRIRSLSKTRRLLLIACLSYGLLMLVGSVADRLSSLKDQLITGGKRSASRIWFALRLIHYQMLPGIYWQKIWLRASGP